MLPEMTPAVSRAIELARRIASGEAEPADVLRGLLAEDEGRAWQLLTAAGLDAAAWRGELQPEAAALAELSPEARALLARAKRLARDRTEDGIVTGELVVLAAVRTLPDVVAQWRHCGLDVERLEVAIVGESDPVPLAEVPASAGRQPPGSVRVTDFRETQGANAPRSDNIGRNPWRVLDAAANRAREGLRVLEDFARFLRDDADSTRALKDLRHELSALLSPWHGQFIGSRDTPGDVGTALAAPTTSDRTSPVDLVRANAKRAQEALRTLEEFSKLLDPIIASRLEQLRYRTYAIERALLADDELRQKLAAAVLYWLASADQCRHDWETTVRAAIAGGVQVVQLREKGLSDRDLLKRAHSLREWTKSAGVLFIVNDRPDVAVAVGADGVHLGQDDLDVASARAIIGDRRLIGVSTHTPEQLERAVADGADYVGIGPTFPSSTKSFTEFAGLDFVRAAASAAVPAFVLGGVSAERLAEVWAAGGRRVAVSAAIAGADDAKAAALELRREIASLSFAADPQ